MSEVIEQGATRWVRPSDYTDAGQKGPYVRRDNAREIPRRSKPYQRPGTPAPPSRRPSRSPDRPLKPFRAPDRPGHVGPLIAPNPDRPGGLRSLSARSAPGVGPRLEDRLSRKLAKKAVGMAVRTIGRTLDWGDAADFAARELLRKPAAIDMGNWYTTGREYWENQCDSSLPPDGVMVRLGIHTFAVPTVNWGCFGGQLLASPGEALPGQLVTGEPLNVGPGVGVISFYRVTHTLNDYVYGIIGKTFERNSWEWTAPDLVITKVAPYAPFDPGISPNRLRFLPSILPQQLVEPAPLLQPMPLELALGLALLADNEVDVARAIALAEPSADALLTLPSMGAIAVGNLEPPRRRPVGPRARPPLGMKERKTIATNAKVAIAIFKVLDKISESAEVVDAFYGALPKGIRDRNRCDKKRGLIDNAGQYGIDNADCKLKVLYKHWDKVDFNDAVENIIRNEVQDRVIGGMYKHLPRNIGHAVDGGIKAVNDGQESVVDYILENL